DADRIYESLRAGATGYLVKRDILEKLHSAIITLHEGGSPMTNSVARKVALGFRQIPASAAGKHLTQREEEILAALARGRLYKEIADELGITFNTVRAHVQNIYKKLHVCYRSEAVRKFRQEKRT
ncbi:MAG TPA: response regulator transcription factor, partial [Verrucomicrobiae bacterium]|nr:response regulator transcription factor [Verrucomicrobiae bacterium]